MADAGEEAEKSWRRAELFETLAHPTRVRILRILEKQPLSFAELKRTLGIESSGNLQHHLGKLGDLIKRTDDGKYAVTDDAREAIRLLDVIRQEHEIAQTRVKPGVPVGTKIRWLVPTLVSITLLILVFYEYSMLAGSIPLFSILDFSKNILEINGTKYYYLAVTMSELENGTAVAFRDALFTYIDNSTYLERAPTFLIPISESFICPRFFRVEFKDGETLIVPILPGTPIVAYEVKGNKTLSFFVVVQGDFRSSPRGLSDLLLRLGKPRVAVVKIGPQTYLFLVKEEPNS
jgi:DNA-binding transcriptional ArsR family regulator